MSYDDTPWLHIRPQTWSHDLAEIVGSKTGLRALSDALLSAIETKAGEAEVFATDGEGYCVAIRRSNTVSGLGQPFYLDDVIERTARGRLLDMIAHRRLIDRQNTEAYAALRWCRANGNPHSAQGGVTEGGDGLAGSGPEGTSTRSSSEDAPND